MLKTKSVEMRCDDGAENLVFTRYEYRYDEKSEDNYEITLEDSYCRTRCNRFVRAWKAFWGKPIYYSGVYTDGKEKVKKWLLDCLHLVNNTEPMANSQVINLLFHIGNNIDRILDDEKDTETYLWAIETAIHKLEEE